MPPGKAPIEAIGDVLPHWTHAGERDPRVFDAWIHADVERSKLLEGIIDNDKVTPGVIDEVAFHSSVVNAMLPLAKLAVPRYFSNGDHEDFHDEFRSDSLELIARIPQGEEVAAVFCESPLEKAELIEIVEAHYASLAEFLVTGDRRAFWPDQRHYAPDQVGDWHEASALEHMVTLGMHLDNDEPNAEYETRMNTVIGKLARLYAENELIGRTVALFSVLTNPDEAQATIEALAQAMQKAKEQYGDEYYQRHYAHAISCLRDSSFKSLFEISLSQRYIQPIEGARRYEKRAGGYTFVTEEYSQDGSFNAHLRSGETIQLPYTHFDVRTINYYRTPKELAQNGHAEYVDYAHLPDDAQKALRERHKRQDKDTPLGSEEIEKFVLGMGYSLHTQAIGEGDYYIQPIGRGIDEPTGDVSGDVTDVELLEQTWLVTEYDGSYAYMQGYTLEDLARIAPEGANAFWFSGNARIVTSESKNPKVMKNDPHAAYDYSSRYVITPVAFYKADARRKI